MPRCLLFCLVLCAAVQTACSEATPPADTPHAYSSSPDSTPAEPAPVAVQRSLLIDEVLIVDGSGGPPVAGAVRIRGERIVAAGALSPLPGEAVVSGAGHVLAPGFIDTHSHHDEGLTEQPAALAAVSQGITTIVRGQDGFSETATGEFVSVAQFNRAFERSPAAINVASYSAHGSLRSHVLGEDFKRTASEEETAQMAQLLHNDMRAGALGLASGLEYDPGIYADIGEMVALGRVAGQYGGRYISHIRSEDRAFWPAIEEIIRIGAQAQIPVQISHMKLAQRSLWGQAERLLARLEQARSDGVQISADVYPYEYWLSTITVLFPDRDFAAIDTARYILQEIVPADGLIFVRNDGEPALAGKSIEQIAAERGQDPAQVLNDVTMAADAYAREHPAAVEYVVGRSMRDDDVQQLLQWAHTNVCSDGSLASEHPRGSGSFPRVLSRYVRERGGLTLTQAVHKMTGLSAAHVGIAKRGLIRAGYYADLVLFDQQQVQDLATMEDPTRLSSGVLSVWVNGQRVFSKGAATGATPGRIVPRSNHD